MDNMWVCESCKSLNRASDPHCYKCREPRPPSGVEPAATPATSGPPQLSAPPSAPGVPPGGASSAPSPAAPAPIPGGSFSPPPVGGWQVAPASGQQVSGGWSALPAAFPTIYCFACGAKIDARAEICPKCGVRQPAPASTWSQGAPPVAATGTGYSIAAIVCGVSALLFFPIVFGPVGLVLGAIAYTRHERLWAVGVTMAAVGGLVGAWIGYVVVASRY